MRTVAIVQARMRSTRLPGKTLMELAGRSVLAHVIERCQGIAAIDSVCCAVADDPESAPLIMEAERCGAQTIVGSEDDVLERYLQAAVATGADIVLRVTSDCPLIDPRVCDEVIGLRSRTGADFACNNTPPSWPHGLDCECITLAWLTRSAREATAPDDREHVTPYARRHGECRKVNLLGPGGEVCSERWTLDTEADLRYLRALFRHLPPGAAGWCWQEAVRVARDAPDVRALRQEAARDAWRDRNASAAARSQFMSYTASNNVIG